MELSFGQPRRFVFWNDHFWFQERPLFIWISKKIGDGVYNSIFNISWRWMAQSLFWLTGAAWFPSLSCFFFQGEEFKRFWEGGGGGTRRRWYLREPVSLRMLLSGMALQTLEPTPGHWRWEGVYLEMLGVLWLKRKVHPLKQCLNQVGGQFARSHGHHMLGAGCQKFHHGSHGNHLGQTVVSTWHQVLKSSLAGCVGLAELRHMPGA